MITNEPVAELRSAATFHGGPLVAANEDFETRWNAWVARGHVHERRGRRRIAISAAAIAIAGAIAFAFLA